MSTSARARRAAALLATLALVAGTTGMAGAAPTPTEPPTDLYVVVLTEPPHPTRSGRPGEVARVRTTQQAVLDEVGGPTPVYRFTAALNGVAVVLTAEQVKRLRAHRDVALVERSTLQRPDSVDSPDFLGADHAWRAAGGPENAGRGTVVGIVDSGIWPENPSFAALPDPGGAAGAAFAGACEPGEQWDASDCNSKVVAARYFVRGFGAENLAAGEFLSPRDGTGHGSHVAAVAAGNLGVDVRVDGQDFGAASGMAPGARIAAYKACWTAPDPAEDGCTTADALAAVDRAVADGVDVISYAVSGPAGAVSDAVELAFLNATAAGVFVATSAGNRGPGEGTVAHASPWVTTAGASTHRSFQGAVVLGDDVHVGAMVSDTPVPRTGIVLAQSATAAGSTSEDARLCRTGSLDAQIVQGRIVVCDRGTIARVEKSAAVGHAGGVGMVLANVRPDTVASDFHAVPTVHVDVAAADAVKRYVAETVHPRAALDPTASDGTPMPQVASFSSRGPVPVDGGSLLKPDLTAPGVAVLSAVAPPSSDGRIWGQLSGTSTSAGHVAGLAAVVVGAQPGWTPAMVKSAMVTTTGDLVGVAGPLAGGAGHLDAGRVLDPGLVLDAAPHRFRGWLAGRVETRNLNLPSVAVGDLTGVSRVVRRVTNVSGGSGSYRADVLGLDGIDVTVRPRTLTLGPGQTGRFTVRFERDDAPLERPGRGQLVWTGSSHRVRLPVVVTPRTVAAPAEASGSGSSGTVSYRGVAGVDGDLALEVTGLAAATPAGITLQPGEFDPSAPGADADTARFTVDVTPGAATLRVELEGRDSDDMDLHLYRDGEPVASAVGGGPDEVLTVVDPSAGEHELYVTSTVAANGSTTTAQLYTWVVGDGDAGNLRTPATVPVRAGEPFGLELTWDGLDPTSRWFGAVRYVGSTQQTFVTVN